MPKAPSTIGFYLSIATLLFTIRFASCQNFSNCLIYNSTNSSVTCSQCMYGYQLGGKNQCNLTLWLKVISIMTFAKQLEPYMTVKSIFCDFISQFWFLASNQSHSHVSRQLSQLIISINNQRLWPFNVREKFELLVAKEDLEKFYDFLNLENNVSQKGKNTIKKDLFVFQNQNFSFTTACGIRILCSFAISLSLWFGLQFLEGLLYFFTDKRILEKTQIKGSLLLMMKGQLYHFVGFYGFYQLRNVEGYTQIGMKLNIFVTLLFLFFFTFESITFLPLSYYFNGQKYRSIELESITKKPIKKISKVHKVLTFDSSPQGFTYYLLLSYFRQFCSGCMIGYFSEGNIYYRVLVLWYAIEFVLLQDIGKSLRSKVYVLFRKAYIVLSVIFLLILHEQNVHTFSDSSYSFGPAQQICLCFLYIVAFTDFMFFLMQIIWKFFAKLKNWLKIKHKIHNVGPLKNQNQKSAKRKLKREPSIAQRILNTLKTTQAE